MRIPRVYVASLVVSGDSMVLAGDEAHHVANVLRRRSGDAVDVCCPDGVYEATVVVAVTGSPARVELLVGSQRSGAAAVPWTVLVSQVKGQGFDLAVRLASELGLAALAPVVCERSVVRGVSASKLERWRRIAREAAKQCGRSPALEIGEELSFADALQIHPGAGHFIASPGACWPGATSFQRQTSAVAGPGEAVFLVGPEGGFSPAEVEGARRAGFIPVGFPTPVLRTATAVAFIAALGSAAAPGSPPKLEENGVDGPSGLG